MNSYTERVGDLFPQSEALGALECFYFFWWLFFFSQPGSKSYCLTTHCLEKIVVQVDFLFKQV